MKNIKRILLLALLTGILFLPKLDAKTAVSELVYVESKSVSVYVTKTGKKYHLSDCSYLRQSKIEIDQKDAIKQGYTACSRCKP
ncbi:MAG: hypothetical protein ABIP95_09210 [Pelobium sp.]